MNQQVVKYCAHIGADRLLVQGAGGNVSWKEGGTLWVKASGTWLSDAAKKDIFVAVDRLNLAEAIAKGDFAPTPKLMQASPMRPSIETVLHALMPQTFVVHLHSVEVLARLVRADFKHPPELDSDMRAILVDYHKPGAELAKAVHAGLEKTPDANVVLLKNHGVVIGGSSVPEVNSLLSRLNKSFAEDEALDTAKVATAKEIAGYKCDAQTNFQALALNPNLFARLERDWALYPDHVVFLGDHPRLFADQKTFEAANFKGEFAFVQNEGVFTNEKFTRAKSEQLSCYFEILRRQKNHPDLASLSREQIHELLNWDAEKYRQR